jgi:hypothetical protein
MVLSIFKLMPTSHYKRGPADKEGSIGTVDNLRSQKNIAIISEKKLAVILPVWSIRYSEGYSLGHPVKTLGIFFLDTSRYSKSNRQTTVR